MRKDRGAVSYLLHLKCRECGRTYAPEPIAACEECWAPLEPVYDYGGLWSDLRRKDIETRPPNMWRYRELLPLEGEPGLGRARVLHRWCRRRVWRKPWERGRYISKTMR